MQHNEHIATLGYRLESTSDVALVRPLLETVKLEPVEDDPQSPASEYLLATTRAGGLAACAGWTRLSDTVVLHSLAVAPPSRGSGVGVSLLAAALSHLMDHQPVESVYLMTASARRFFASYGFIQVEADEIPTEVRSHPTFAMAEAGSTPMVRHYQRGPRGLDQCAFRLLENRTPNAVLPTRSVIFFKQAGQMLEANYRGGPVARGHILGKIDGDHIRYLWHAYSDEDEVLNGDGHWRISSLPDGRRELREIDDQDVTLLIMREV